MTSLRYRRRPLLFVTCDHGPCQQTATHTIEDSVEIRRIGVYCHDHATERVMAMNKAEGWSPSGQGGM